MRNKVHLRKKTPIIKNNLFLASIILIIIAVIMAIGFIGKQVTPKIIDYAEMELEKFSTRIINKVIGLELSSVSTDDLFIITKDNEGYIKTIDYNPISVNRVLANITTKVDKILRDVEKGNDLSELSDEILLDYDVEKLKKGVVFEIAIGLVLNNPLLTNIGPKIPVKLTMVGSTNSNLNTKITNYGINNALVETSIVMNVGLKIVLPYITEKVNFQNNVPISVKLIQGTVPNYYFNGIDKNSPTFVIPIE